MKTKLFVTMLMTAGLLMRCSNDDATVDSASLTISPYDITENDLT